MLTLTDELGAVTEYAYDANGNLLRAQNALGGTEEYTYDGRNAVLTASDVLGAVTSLTYDAAGRLTSATDALGSAESYAYDALGKPTERRDRDGGVTLYEYDALSRLAALTDPAGGVTRYSYDKNGDLLSVTDPNGNLTSNTYDALRRLTATRGAAGGYAEYAYDAAGNLLTELSPLGHETAYTYDAAGRVLTRTDELGGVTSYTYDLRGRLTTRTDADGETRFTYNAAGDMLTAADASGTVTLTRDALSRVTAVTNADGTDTAYAYDLAGNRLSVTYPDGSTVRTAYDILGRLTALTDHDGSGTTYAYTAAGRLTRESHSDGSATAYSRDALGRVTEQIELAPAGNTLRRTALSYDAAGNLTREVRSGVEPDRRTQTLEYAYDAANRLIRATLDGQATEYRYDAAGNILSDGNSTYAYDLQNRLTERTGYKAAKYEYDAAGNLVKMTAEDVSASYSYNAQNRLVRGELSDGQSSSYRYDALGARVENIQIRVNKNAAYRNGDLRDGSHDVDYLDFLKDGRATWQRTWETEAGTVMQNDFETVTRHYTVDYLSAANRDIIVTEDGSFTQRYVYDNSGRRISAEFDYAEGTERGTTNAKGEYGANPASDIAVLDIGKVWYRTSLLDSTVFAVDADGEVVAHMSYDPWGNPTAEVYMDINLSGLENLNNFTGYTWDETLKLYFAQNRFYDPSNHRFTQEDPIKDNTNWYAYCGNNPLVNVDFNGHMPVKWLRAIELAYIKDIIPDDYIGSAVIVANVVSKAIEVSQIINVFSSFNIRGIYDLFSEVDDEVKDKDPSTQALYLSFHETAQIVAAKQIKKAYGGIPILEEIVFHDFNFREMDITLGDYVWEVKPGYTSDSSFVNSLKKYVKDYNADKDPSDYTTKWGWKIPGGAFEEKEVKLFSLGDKEAKMTVKWLGPGKVGYFFQMKCENGKYEEVRAKNVAPVLIPVFKKAENVNTASKLATVGALFIAAVLSPIPGDEAVAGAALTEMLVAAGLA